LYLQIDVVTQRGFVPVDERMRVIDANGKLVCINLSNYPSPTYCYWQDLVWQVPHLFCIGDANGKMMLAHAASAQGISGKW